MRVCVCVYHLIVSYNFCCCYFCRSLHLSTKTHNIYFFIITFFFYIQFDTSSVHLVFFYGSLILLVTIPISKKIKKYFQTFFYIAVWNESVVFLLFVHSSEHRRLCILYKSIQSITTNAHHILS